MAENMLFLLYAESANKLILHLVVLSCLFSAIIYTFINDRGGVVRWSGADDDTTTMAAHRAEKLFHNFTARLERARAHNGHEMREFIKNHVLYSTNAPFNNLFGEHKVCKECAVEDEQHSSSPVNSATINSSDVV